MENIQNAQKLQDIGTKETTLLERLQKFEGMDLLVDLGGSIDFPTQELNNITVREWNNKILLQDEDDDKMPVAIDMRVIDYIERMLTGEGIIYILNGCYIRIMFRK